MAGNPIAELVANLRFNYQKGALTQFKKDLQTTAKQIDGKQGIVGSFHKANKSQQQYFKDLTRGFQQTKPNIIQSRRQLARIREAFKNNQISHQQYVEGRRRGLMTINKLEQEQHIKRMRRARELARANGPFAGGRDPRQAGDHRLISAIHSDVGLGALAGGFAAAQSVRAYQGIVAMEQGLTAATGSAERAGQEMEFLIDLSQRLGLFVGDLGQSFSSFAAAARGSSLSAKEVRDTFEGVASQARVLNLSAADTEGVMRSLVQMMNKGQIMAEELKNQMAERLPGSMQAASRAAYNLGITQEATTQELFKAMEAGELMAEEFLPELSKELMKSANEGGALEKAIKSTGAAIGRFQTNVFLANKTFNEAGFDRGIRNLLNTMSEFINKSDELWKLLGSTAGFLAQALRAPFELFTQIAQAIGFVTEKGAELNLNYNQMTGIFLALFKWGRRLLAIFVLLPYAISAMARAWDEGGIGNWAIALVAAGAAALVFRKRIKSAIDLLKSGKSKAEGFRKALTGEKTPAGKPPESIRKPSGGQSPSSSGGSFGGKLGKGVGVAWMVTELLGLLKGGGEGEPLITLEGGKEVTLQSIMQSMQGRMSGATMEPLLGPGGGMQQGQLPFGPQMHGDININIDGASPRVADEVVETINNMFRETAIQSPSEEK